MISESDRFKNEEEKWRKKFFGSFGDREERHGFGDILATEVKFHQIGDKFKSLLENGKSPKDIMNELSIDQGEFSIFMKKVGKITINQKMVRLFEDREYTDLKEFLDGHDGDLDIISWGTYYEVLRIFAKKELALTRHHKDASGLLMSPGKIEELMMAAFKKKYSRGVKLYVAEWDITPYRIVAKKSTKSSFGGFNVTFKNAEFAEESFAKVLKDEKKAGY